MAAGRFGFGYLYCGMAGQRVCDLYASGLVQRIPHKSYTAQIYDATTFADFCFPFAYPSGIFRGHMLKRLYTNANTRTFRSMLSNCSFRWVRLNPPSPPENLSSILNPEIPKSKTHIYIYREETKQDRPETPFQFGQGAAHPSRFQRPAPAASV